LLTFIAASQSRSISSAVTKGASLRFRLEGLDLRGISFTQPFTCAYFKTLRRAMTSRFTVRADDPSDCRFSRSPN
jgi:hypothetical protein